MGFYKKGTLPLKVSFFILSAFLIISGAFFSFWTIKSADEKMRTDLLLQAEIVSRTLNISDIKALEGSFQDIDLLEYKRLKSQLTDICSIIPNCRFAYILGKKETGKEYNVVDSEKVSSQFYDPPGYEYDEPQKIDEKVFKTGIAQTDGPISDSAGTYITALVPINDPDSNNILVLLGLDIDTKGWTKNILRQTWLSVALIFLMEIVFIVFWYIHLQSKKLKQSEDRLKTIADSVTDGIIMTDSNGKIAFWNNGAEKTFGYDSIDIEEKKIYDLIEDSTATLKFKNLISDYLLQGKDFSSLELETFGKRKDGKQVLLSVSLSKIIFEKKHYFVGIFRDITQARTTRDTLEKIIDNNPISIQLVDNNGYSIRTNPAHLKLFGAVPSENYSVFSDPVIKESGLQNLLEKAQKGEELIFPEILYNAHKINSRFPDNPLWIRAIMFPLIGSDNKPEKYVIMHQDITQERKKQKDIEYLSFHDQLTGLYNRRFFETELAVLDEPENMPLGIVVADVNGLKLTNDAFGHFMGDRLLRTASDVLKSVCSDKDLLARTGGDEFIIILPQTSEEQIRTKIEKIKELSGNTYVEDIPLSISLGSAIKFQGYQSIYTVMKNADDCMYRQKLFESSEIKEKTVATIIKAFHNRFFHEKEHGERVGGICYKFSKLLGYTEIYSQEIKTAGIMHDIGKINIAVRILAKRETLNDNDWKEIKKHPETGYRILSSVGHMAQLAEYILAHHERWDGKGYPKGLKGEEIPLQSRIIAIAEAYEIMRSKRTYKASLSEEQAFKELDANSGTQFDPFLVRMFIQNSKQIIDEKEFQ
jgi:diguanylate cyclase (GGDEF)-like protein/PAS domain S-box-containing protein